MPFFGILYQVNLMQYGNIKHEDDFERLYLFYFPKLVRFSRKYVLAEEEAENIVQDVFIILWEQKEQLSHIQHIPSYIFQLTKNKCIDFLRHQILIAEKKQQLQEIHIREFEYRLRSMRQLDNNLFDEKELETLVHEAIQSLPERCRKIFMLSRFEGLSHQEIAIKCNISQNTVNNQITLAMRKLKELLKDHLYLFFFL